MKLLFSIFIFHIFELEKRLKKGVFFRHIKLLINALREGKSGRDLATFSS